MQVIKRIASNCKAASHGLTKVMMSCQRDTAILLRSQHTVLNTVAIRQHLGLDSKDCNHGPIIVGRHSLGLESKDSLPVQVTLRRS